MSRTLRVWEKLHSNGVIAHQCSVLLYLRTKYRNIYAIKIASWTLGRFAG